MSENKKIEILLSIWYNAIKVGEKEIAENIFKKINDKIKLVEKEDWEFHQICGDFPEVDKRCLVFCCSPVKNCPYRNAVLQKMGLTIRDYTKMKRNFANQIK